MLYCAEGRYKGTRVADMIQLGAYSGYPNLEGRTKEI
jgi:hypothetical protein